MITVTGLKTSKLEKGFSLHAKEIGPGPGVLVSNGECENIYRYVRAGTFIFKFLIETCRGFPKSLYVHALFSTSDATVIM